MVISDKNTEELLICHINEMISSLNDTGNGPIFISLFT